MFRPAIPKDLERKVLIEAGHRCAIPTCRHIPVEIAHIIPYAKVKKHTFENLIALCPNCHSRYDQKKDIDRKAMKIYKSNLGLLNNRYGELEIRIIAYFSERPNDNMICLPGLHELHIMYMIKDRLLVKTEIAGPCINGVPTWEVYQLTQEGREFTDKWKEAQSLE